MSIQDDIFDVQSALEDEGDKATLEAYERLIDYLSRVERAMDTQDALLNDLRRGVAALKGLT